MDDQPEQVESPPRKKITVKKDPWTNEERSRMDWDGCDQLLELLQKHHPEHGPKS